MARRHALASVSGLSLLVFIMSMFVAAAPVGAHPLGNFTVNRYARLEATAGELRIYYVVDEAEIPAFQRRDEVADDPEGFAIRRVGEIVEGIELVVDGKPVTPRAGTPSLSQPAGEAGLDTLRLAVVLSVPLTGGPGAAHDVRFVDRNEPRRLGWREVLAVARGDTVIESSSVPSDDVSDELRSYPSSRLQSPLDVRDARLRIVEGSEALDELPIGDRVEAIESGDGFVGLIDERDLSVIGTLLLFATAFGFGAVHALAPGHGKTLMAAYLVGTRGRTRDALLLGSIVSIMHTASVLVLGIGLYHLARDRAPESIYPVLQVAAGALVATWGALLLARRARALRRSSVAHDHHHDHDHAHDHDHDHHHGPGGHTHALPADTSVLSRRGIAVLAAAGGIFPSPSALVVLLSAFALGRAGFGLALVGAFSIGLAATLTAIGVALIYGRRFVSRSGTGAISRLLPTASAIVIIVVGVYLALRGAAELS